MLVFAINDIPTELDSLCAAISTAEPGAKVQAFLHPLAAVNALRREKRYPCAVFIAIEMSELDGIELTKLMLKEIPWLNIIFVADSEKYMKEAFSLHASGYLLNPIGAEDIHEEIVHLRTPLIPNASKRVQIQTFGNFEVRIDGHPVKFRHGKTLEYLAYLVDRGTLCTNKEIAAALWEKKVHDSYIRQLRKDLVDTFEAAGCGDILILQTMKQGIRPEKISCDYYDWLNGKPNAVHAYRGEYMAQYSWAEFTHGTIA